MLKNTSQKWANRDLCDRTGRIPMEWLDKENAEEKDHAEEKDLPSPVLLSKDDKALISSSFTIVLPNFTWRKVRDNFPLLDLR